MKSFGEAAHADGIADRVDVLAAAHGDLFSFVAVRFRRNRTTVQLRFEVGGIVDLGVDLERDAVAEVVHAARGDGQAEGEGFQDAGIVRIALREALHGHQVVERLGRVLSGGDGLR